MGPQAPRKEDPIGQQMRAEMQRRQDQQANGSGEGRGKKNPHEMFISHRKIILSFLHHRQVHIDLKTLMSGHCEAVGTREAQAAAVAEALWQPSEFLPARFWTGGTSGTDVTGDGFDLQSR